MPHLIIMLPHAVHVNVSYKGVDPLAVAEYNQHVGALLDARGVSYLVRACECGASKR